MNWIKTKVELLTTNQHQKMKLELDFLLNNPKPTEVRWYLFRLSLIKNELRQTDPGPV